MIATKIGFFAFHPNQVCKSLLYLGLNPAVTYQFTRHFPKSLHTLLGTLG